MTLKKKDTDDIVIMPEYTKEEIELIYTDGYKRRCYPVLAGLRVDYEK